VLTPDDVAQGLCQNGHLDQWKMYSGVRRCKVCVNAACRKSQLKKQASVSKTMLGPKPPPVKLKRKPENNRKYKLWMAYKLTPEMWDAMLDAQGYACAICSRTWEKSDSNLDWHVDHDHTSGEVRGILCTHCNLGLGHFKDNPQYLRQAVEYLALAG
jgi:5-methylcytosine-specific restriction endonuclease McrA